MSKKMVTVQPIGSPIRLLGITLTLLGIGAASHSAPAEETTRLLDLPPFDRVTLNAANGGTTIDTVLLDLPNRRVPRPLPTSGVLELRRLSQPSVLYQASWTSIAKIELYEQLLLQEAIRLTNSGKFVEAFEYLAFLHKHYPRLTGLERASQTHLRQDALALSSAGQLDASLAVLMSLYQRNAKRNGLTEAVESVSDRLISRYLSAKNYSSARGVLELLQRAFPDLPLENVQRWQRNFEAAANEQLSLARRAIEERRFSAAREAVGWATTIWPSIEGGRELLAETFRLWPEVVVGVHSLAPPGPRSALTDWTSTRVQRLIDPWLVELADYGAEGGVYQCRWGRLSTDDAGLHLQLRLNEQALRLGLSADRLARYVLAMCDTHQVGYREDLAAAIRQVGLVEGNRLDLGWQRSHLRPEALLQFPLRSVVESASGPVAYQQTFSDETQIVRYELPQQLLETRSGPRSIIERAYDDEEGAILALLRGEVDLLDRIPPWQVDRLGRAKGVVVSAYRLPTVHMLLLRGSDPLLRRREFRRALCYGIDRQQIVSETLRAGKPRPGLRVLSGPFPSGVTYSDPIGYATKAQIEPRPYEPRLAAVLAGVARNALAKPSAKDDQPTESAEESASAPSQSTGPRPLVLAHPSDPVARTVCQTIKLQLGVIGIPIELSELAPRQDPLSAPCDLLYAELAIWEPLVDARRLLGPTGIAGLCSPSMSLALDEVDRAENTRESFARLKQVHQIAFHDLPVIPLWQTVNHFAHSESLHGVGAAPVALYQHIADWRKTFDQVER